MKFLICAPVFVFRWIYLR